MTRKKTPKKIILWLLLGLTLTSGTCVANNNVEKTELTDITRQLNLIEHRVNIQASRLMIGSVITLIILGYYKISKL